MLRPRIDQAEGRGDHLPCLMYISYALLLTSFDESVRSRQAFCLEVSEQDTFICASRSEELCALRGVITFPTLSWRFPCSLLAIRTGAIKSVGSGMDSCQRV